jgi:Mg2+-importing ATPase
MMKYLLMGTSSNFGNMFSMAGASIVLPFLPMLPTQILLNNFLYDLAQVTIPTDHVDGTYIRKPQHWNLAIIRAFMVVIGPISSIYDFLTFFAMLRLFHASELLFHTGWFVESLVTQTLVLFVIRTAGNPLCSRPSLPLTLTVLLIVLTGILLPYSPLAGTLGFTPLPPSVFPVLERRDRHLFAAGRSGQAAAHAPPHGLSRVHCPRSRPMLSLPFRGRSSLTR